MYFYIHNQTPAGQADRLLKSGGSPPFADHKDLYAMIDSIALGDVKWEGFTCTYTGEKPNGHPPWMDGTYDPYHEYSTNGDERQLRDFMSADWAWNQADIIAGDPETLGSTFMPIILRSDKMTVSVTTGNNEYYPLYLSIRNVHNNPGMSTPKVAKFGDGHFRHVIYDLGPYIADYKEQVHLACIVSLLVSKPFTNDFPRADIHKIMAPDILHQVIKGTFKDHLVDWVEKYLVLTHGRTEADCILDDIDHRIAAVSSFSGLHHFPQGWGFKQWTGDDSKALMKVYIPAIEGHVPADIVRAFRALLEFCYLHTLDEIQDAVSHFHQYRKIFKTSGIIPTFLLPWQHSLMHYTHVIRLFGTSNGLCSSITESKHIKAALGQMLVTNQRLSKLAAARVDFDSHGMLKANDRDNDNDIIINHGPTVLQAHTWLAQTVPTGSNTALCAETKHAHNVLALAEELHLPSLPALICCFLYEQTCPNNTQDLYEIPLAACPRYEGKISVFNSVCSRFYALSDLCGIGGMRVEHISSCSLWRNEFSCYDCVFVNTGSDTEGIRGLEIARVHAFFSFNYAGTAYPCAVVRWFDVIGDSPDPETGMWMVRPAYNTNHFVLPRPHSIRM
ncbi:hypothetical protein DFH29DRAFT_1016390 [Suillus ampliporus]|nr:hypothetical protein DFH29DRAFT_1016390 [Suillus ampliporus]